MANIKLKKDGTPSRQGEGGGKYKSERELYDKIFNEDTGFFKDCIDKGIRPSKVALRVFLDLVKPSYSRYKHKFETPLKRAEQMIEMEWVERLNSNSPTGAIFYLKNAYFEDYRDRTETDITSGGKKIIPILGGLSKKK